MTTDDEPIHTESPTASLLVELQLYGHRPFQDEPDARPLPEDRIVRGALADIFDALVSTMLETRLEPDLEELLWGTVNLFQRTVTQIERELDTNEAAQKRSQRDQDGSEIASVELEKLLAEGLTLIERRNAFEAMRDGRRRTVRGPHRLAVAPAPRLTRQLQIADCRRNRQPRVYRRPPPRPERSPRSRRPEDRLHRWDRCHRP